MNFIVAVEDGIKMLCPQCHEHWPEDMFIETPAGEICEPCHETSNRKVFHRISIAQQMVELGVPEDEENQVQTSNI